MSNTIQHAVSVEGSPRARGRSWAAIGIVTAVGSFVSVFLSMMLSPEYIPGAVMTSEALDASLAAKRPIMIAFHVVTLASGLLLVVFAAGLHRRLKRALPADSLVPVVALSGLLLVTVSQVLGTGLDTEFLFGVGDTAINLPGDIGFYSHWVATIPWVWAGGGLAALALGFAGRDGAVPRWMAATSVVLGALIVLIALSPLQYMAAGPGVLWLLVISLGFAAGDRAHRRRGRATGS